MAELAFDVLFTADMLLEFSTATFSVSHEGYIVDRGIISKHYISRCFFPDLISSLPLHLLGWGSSIQMNRI
eukprot:gene32154-40671_t